MDKLLFDDRSGNHNNVYFNELDFIKAIAIIAVIILHTVPSHTLFSFFAPFHIWHAVPVFIMIAGINSTLSIHRRARGRYSFLNEYSGERIKSHFQRIWIPFSIAWLFEILFLLAKQATPGEVIFSYFAGGIGPGSYFIPIFIQHILLFPIILWVKNKFNLHNQFIMLAAFFLVSVFLEWLCIAFTIPEWLYRLLYVRYLFAAVIGSSIVSHGLSKKAILLTVPLSVTYIVYVSYLKYSCPFIYAAWDFQHAPAYFYTAFLVSCLWRIYPHLRHMDRLFLPIGKASYHIFLCQMIWFWIFAQFVRKVVTNDIIYLALNILVCLSMGYAFYAIQVGLMHNRPRGFGAGAPGDSSRG